MDARSTAAWASASSSDASDSPSGIRTGTDGHARLAPEEQRPTRPRECGVDFLKRLSVPFQSDEERGVAEVDAAADDHVVPFVWSSARLKPPAPAVW